MEQQYRQNTDQKRQNQPRTGNERKPIRVRSSCNTRAAAQNPLCGCADGGFFLLQIQLLHGCIVRSPFCSTLTLEVVDGMVVGLLLGGAPHCYSSPHAWSATNPFKQICSSYQRLEQRLSSGAFCRAEAGGYVQQQTESLCTGLDPMQW